MNEHARRQCLNTPGVYWKGAEVPCFYCGCVGKPAIPPTAKCAQTWHPSDDRRNVGAA